MRHCQASLTAQKFLVFFFWASVNGAHELVPGMCLPFYATQYNTLERLRGVI